DAELVRLIDGEGEAEERARVLAHTATCAQCAERLEMIRHRGQRLSELLADWDAHTIPVPDSPLSPGDLESARARRRSPAPASLPVWMRAAAGIVLLLGVGMTVSPLRAWVMEQWAEVAAQLAGREMVEQPERPRVAAPGHLVSFLPEGDEFLLQVDAPQAEGVLELLIEAVPRASAEISGGGAEENLLVLPEGLRIRNAAGSQASYRVTLPAELREVRVRIGDSPAVSYDPRTLSLPARRVLDLRSRGQP
ncbi:MAG TPA: hypothetical protein VGR27_04255, partial [Longimicrobiaceae bacterium]|nr:hypothetical protein [Longimicrobiaceae bacterium]